MDCAAISDPAGAPSAAHIQVTFIEPNGRHQHARVFVGQNLMDAGLSAGVLGITGQCGGAINCATCLCDVPHDWLLRLPAAQADEAELLSYVDEAGSNSRLSCQIAAAPDLDGLVVVVVASGVG